MRLESSGKLKLGGVRSALLAALFSATTRGGEPVRKVLAAAIELVLSMDSTPAKTLWSAPEEPEATLAKRLSGTSPSLGSAAADGWLMAFYAASKQFRDVEIAALDTCPPQLAALAPLLAGTCLDFFSAPAAAKAKVCVFCVCHHLLFPWPFSLLLFLFLLLLLVMVMMMILLQLTFSLRLLLWSTLTAPDRIHREEPELRNSNGASHSSASPERQLSTTR